MDARPIEILMLGNCLDQGTDVRTGTSYAELSLRAVRERNRGVEIHFIHEVLPHLTLMDRAVDSALRRGCDVVVLGTMVENVQRPIRINRLWSLDPRLAQGIITTMRALQRAGGSSTRGRAAVEDRRWAEPFRVTMPQQTLEQLERRVDAQVARLRAARVEVVLRGDDAMNDRMLGVPDQGADAVIARVAARHDAFAFFPAEHLGGDPRSLTTPKETRSGDVWHVFNEAAHARVARSMESALGSAVDRVLAARAAGRPGVLARVERPDDGITVV